jgi:hypothetical protein
MRQAPARTPPASSQRGMYFDRDGGDPAPPPPRENADCEIVEAPPSRRAATTDAAVQVTGFSKGLPLRPGNSAEVRVKEEEKADAAARHDATEAAKRFYAGRYGAVKTEIPEGYPEPDPVQTSGSVARRLKVCVHQREKRRCKECGGSAFCVHQRLKRRPDDDARPESDGRDAPSLPAAAPLPGHDSQPSGGGAKRQKIAGSSLCPHQRRRSQCKDCGGGSFCEHLRRRSTCKDCGGSGLCPHQRQRSTCKDCGGSSICPHQRQRSQCKDCGGSGLCPPQRQRSKCKDCGGSSLCPHQRQRSMCKDCGGSSLCPHQRQRSKCKDCGGN